MRFTMAPFLWAAAVLFGVASAAAVQTGGASSSSSVSQIRDTLRNLLRSIEDNGRDAEALFGKRQQWCDSAIHEFEAANQAAGASLLDMQAQLTETQAEVEEAEGTVQQVKVDIEMVQHTIKQTEDMEKERTTGQDSSLLQSSGKPESSLLSSLVDNKKLSLASLQGELEVSVPVLAQLQGNVAETKQRISYRTESLAVAKDFISSLKDSCQGGADRADSQAAARVGEANSLHVALQALDQVSGPKASSDDKDDDSQDAEAVSFVQVTDRSDEVTTDDLSDLFASVPAAAETSASKAVVSRRVREPATSDMAVAPSMRPRIETLLTQLKNDGSADGSMDQAAWCAKQRESSGMALKFAQDSVAQLNSELASHTDAEAELSEELQRLKTVAAAVTDSAKTALDQANKEDALIKSSRKDQQLATKILDQATTILKDLDVSMPTIVGALDSAKRMLLAQIKAAAGFQQESSGKAKAVGEKALALAQSQESEQHNLEFAQDDHTSQRLRGVENMRLYQADVQEATDYVQKLAESCKTNAESGAQQQRSVQVHALEDADKVLAGKLTEAKSPVNNLRGVEASSPKPTDQNLTPMQRAAAEMGVSMDS